MKFKIEKKEFNIVRPNLKIGLVLVVAVILFLFFHLPWLKAIIDWRGEIKESEKKLAVLTEKIDFLRKLDRKKLDEEAEMALRAVPEKNNPLFLIQTLNNFSAREGVAITSLEIILPETATDSAQSLEKDSPLAFELRLEGGWDNFLDFLRGLDLVMPLMKIQEANFKVENGNNFEAFLKIQAPLLSLPKTLGLPSKPLSKLSDQEKEILAKLKLGEDFFSRSAFREVPAGKTDPFAF